MLSYHTLGKGFVSLHSVVCWPYMNPSRNERGLRAKATEESKQAWLFHNERFPGAPTVLWDALLFSQSSHHAAVLSRRCPSSDSEGTHRLLRRAPVRPRKVVTKLWASVGQAGRRSDRPSCGYGPREAPGGPPARHDALLATGLHRCGGHAGQTAGGAWPEVCSQRPHDATGCITLDAGTLGSLCRDGDRVPVSYERPSARDRRRRGDPMVLCVLGLRSHVKASALGVIQRLRGCGCHLETAH